MSPNESVGSDVAASAASSKRPRSCSGSSAYAFALLTARANSASSRALSVESISNFRLVLGDDFLFSTLVFALAFFTPVLSNQLGVAVRRRFIARQLRFRRQHKRCWPGCFERARIFKSRFFQPALDLVKGKSVAAFGVDQHVDGEDQTIQRLGPFIVDQPFADRNRAAGFERVSCFLQQLAATMFAFAVQNVTEGGDVVAFAEISLQYVTFDKFETVTHAKFLGDAFRYGNHASPIDRGYLHA